MVHHDSCFIKCWRLTSLAFDHKPDQKLDFNGAAFDLRKIEFNGKRKQAAF